MSTSGEPSDVGRCRQGSPYFLNRQATTQSPSSVRKSPRLQAEQRLRGQCKTHDYITQLPSPTSNTPCKEISVSSDRKRKRSHEPSIKSQEEASVSKRHTEPDQKRPRHQPPVGVTKGPSSQAATSDRSDSNILLRHWVEEGNWPAEYFQPDSNMNHSLTRKRSTPSLSSQQSGTSGASLREGKNPAARSRRYEDLLEASGINMWLKPGVIAVPTDSGKALCQTLLDTKQETPRESLFDDDIFEGICLRAQDRNEARIIRDLTPLLVPSAEILNARGALHLAHVVESVDESWSKCIPMINGPCPKPDFSVGLRSSAFTAAQREKLKPFVGGWQIQSRLMATDKMHFPFLTAEVKCGQEGLIIAERQNAYSASIAANAVVELYRVVSRQHELHRQILSFSISHNHRSLDIYGHYALINGEDISFHRYEVQSIPFANTGGRDKWRPYCFTRNIYDTFLPIHLKRLCSAIDQLPNPEVFVPDPLSESSNTQAEGQLAATSSVTSPETSSEPVFKKPKAKGAP